MDPCGESDCLTAVLLELPVSVVQRADLASLEPTRDAMEMEGVIADAPGYGAFLAGSRCLVGLAVNAQVHDVVTANGTVVDNNIPGPESDGIPLLDFEALLSRVGSCVGLGGLGLGRSIGHFNVGHVDW